MELTQLNPKVERHLIEVQKILDRDPAVCKKLWITLFVAIITTAGILWFTQFFKPLPEDLDKDGASYSILFNTVICRINVSFRAGSAAALCLMFIPFAVGRDISFQVMIATRQLYNNLKTSNPEETAAYFSDKEHKYYQTINRRHRNLIFFFCTITAMQGFIFSIYLLMGGRFFDFLLEDMIYSPTTLITIKWLSISTGFMCGMGFMMSVMMMIISGINLLAVPSFHDKHFLKLRKLEREICEKESA